MPATLSDQKRVQQPLTRKDTKIARKEIRAGLSPLEMLLAVSRHYYDEWEADPGDKDTSKFLVMTAEKTAPYVHAKRASIQNEHNVKGEITINIGGKTGDL